MMKRFLHELPFYDIDTNSTTPHFSVQKKHRLAKIISCLMPAIFSLFFVSTAVAQVQALVGNNMESKTGWVVYNMGSVTPATYTFNYTGQKPTQGIGACLRITSTTNTSILFWQRVIAKAGESYTVDGAIKTSNAANFWAEIYVSTISPVEGTEYLPNNNGDVVAGFSTWNGCGPNVNGTFAVNACYGKKTFVVPGTAGASVAIYFGFKTGSSAVPLPNPLEVLVDELKLLRTAGTGNTITSLSLGTIQAAAITVPGNIKGAQLKSALAVSPYASYKLLSSSNAEVSNTATVTNTMKVVVTAENGAAKTYTIATTAPAIAGTTLNNTNTTVTSYENKNLTITGASQITITSATNPLRGSSVNLTSENVWLYFPGIKPSVVNQLYCPQITVNGAAAIADQNIRVVQYLQGTMVISQPSGYKALQIFNGENLTGTSLQIGNYTYNNSAELSTLNNAVKSFRLKRGYMATFAQNESGLGASKVYIADNQDVVINKLPASLYNQVSFVRVIPWRWTAKKGWTNGQDAANALNCQWQYDWNNEAISSLDIEYVPMRHNLGWNAFSNINNKINSTHALGFNEPDRVDQSNISVDDAITQWPELMKSGLRLGSPAPSDASAGLTWLYKFIDKCDSLKYRVDFVTVHWYKGGQTARQFYDWLKAVHIRTKRPVWITEWNNGANWTCCKPTFAQQAQAITEMTNMLDTASFVERYSLYEWVENTRQMFYESPVSLTPAGVVYSNNVTPMSFNPALAYNTLETKATQANNLAELAPESTNEIEIYPNPAEDQVHIRTSIKLKNVAVYNAAGGLIKTGSSNFESQTTINMQGFAPGVYVIKLSNGKKTWERKILKVRKN